MTAATERKHPTDTKQTTSPDRHRRRGSLLLAVAGISLILVGLGAVLVAGSYDEKPTVRVAGSDAPVNLSARSTTDISAHNSPSLARNPRNAANLAVSSRIDTPFFSCALHVSADGGASWTQTSIPAPKGEEAKCFGPDVAFGADGTMYYSFVTLAGRGNVPHAVWLSTSKDGGKSLSDPVRVGGDLNFQVRVAPDPTNAKRVYITSLHAKEVGTLKFTEPGNPIEIVRSDDGGATFSEPVRVSGVRHQRAIAPSPVVGDDGKVYVLYLDVGDDRLDYEGGHLGRGGPPFTGPSQLVLARSEDNGATWDESIAGEGLIPMKRFLVFLPEFPSIAVARDGRVYAAYHSAKLGDPDVYVWTLAPGSKSWTGPVRVNDTKERDGTAQYLPKLAVAPGGRLDVLYYDRRADAQNLQNEVAFQSSFDEAKTFTRAINLASHRSDSRIGFGAKEGLPDLGSRLGLISTDRAALGLWTDTRNGIPATQKQDLAAAAVAVSDPERLSEDAQTALRWGGLLMMLVGIGLLGFYFKPRTA